MFKEINFIDESLRHCGNFTYGSTVQVGGVCPPLTHREPKQIIYIRDQKNWNGVTLFTDDTLNKVKSIESKYKVAWLIEPRHYRADIYKKAEKLISFFDLILTYDEYLLNKYQDKCKFIPSDTVVIENEAIKIQKKNELISFSLSNKNFLEGHKFRIKLLESLKKKKINLDFYGTGPNNFVKLRSDTIKNYYFSIAIENGILNNYFTDRILDCFATGTIPIYRGAPNISEYFDVNGIITFTEEDELFAILDNLNVDLYNSKIKSVEKNFSLCQEYLYLDDKILEEINKYFYER